MNKKILIGFLTVFMCFTLVGCVKDQGENNSLVNDGNNTYLTPTSEMYTKDSKGKRVLNSSLDEIELEEHSITMNNNKATDTKTNNTYKITNASGKTFNFGEFRHL